MHYLQCPQQVDSKQCGFFVMILMAQLLSTSFTNFPNTVYWFFIIMIKSKNKHWLRIFKIKPNCMQVLENQPHTIEAIDEFRSAWCGYFLRQCL